LLACVLAAPADAKTINVRSGQLIQAAVDRASPGDTVRVARGQYVEVGRPCPVDRKKRCAVVIVKDDISLVGAKGAVLGARKGQYQGIAVGRGVSAKCLTQKAKRVHGSLISGFTVRGFDHDGIFLGCVDNYRVTNVRTTGNVEYGIFPSHALNGRVDHSYASGSNDTGIYIGQSRKARVDHNTAEKNVSGFEIENSTGIRVDHNVANGNTAGILSFALPKLDIKVNDSNIIESNTVTANNKKNTCADPDDTVCKVPAGTGILLVAADSNQVKSNTVTGNNSFGIAVANYCLALGASEAECKALDIDPDSDKNRVTSNKASGNGTNPDPGVPAPFAADLAWDTSGDGNCWASNQAGKVFPDPLPAC
jgi:parallel beta-helix repeat protein